MTLTSEQVKARVDAVGIYARYLELKKAGRQWRALCPFHSESTPSFFIFPDGGYHCFGCGAHGDVIDFVMKRENWSFGETLAHLAGENFAPSGKVIAFPAPRVTEHVHRTDLLPTWTQLREFQEAFAGDRGVQAWLRGRGVSEYWQWRAWLGLAEVWGHMWIVIPHIYRTQLMAVKLRAAPGYPAMIQDGKAAKYRSWWSANNPDKDMINDYRYLYNVSELHSECVFRQALPVVRVETELDALMILSLFGDRKPLVWSVACHANSLTSDKARQLAGVRRGFNCEDNDKAGKADRDRARGVLRRFKPIAAPASYKDVGEMCQHDPDEAFLWLESHVRVIR